MVLDRLIVLAAIALATQSARSGTILYVDDSAPPGGGDGATWATALDDLEEALAAAAEPGSPVDEIWVAEGLYVPSMRLDPDAPRSATPFVRGCRIRVPGLSYLVRVGATEGSGVGVLTVTCEASPGGATDSAGVGSPHQSVGRIQY